MPRLSTRRPPPSDAALALAVVVLVIVSTPFGPVEENGRLGWAEPVQVPISAYALIAVGGLAIYWRRRHPLVVFVIVSAAAVSYEVLAYQTNVEVSFFVALYSVGRHVTDNVYRYGAVAVVCVVIGIASAMGGEPVADIGFNTFLVWIVWFSGDRLRARQQRAEARHVALEAQAQRAVAAERAHIARELHDVVAHRVSMMTVQSGAAKTVAGVDPAAATEAMGAVEREGRQALVELRHLLDVLRPDTSDDLGPQPGLADIPRLVERHVANGMDVSLVTDDQVVTIEVTDTGTGVVGAAGSGFGLIGMRERAQLLGGSLEASPRPDGGFKVVARLPIGPAQR